MAQASSHPLARRVLEVDEESFKALVRELARDSRVVQHFSRENQLRSLDIVLGHIRPSVGEHEAVAEVPYCLERYGDSRGVFSITVSTVTIGLQFRCAVEQKSGLAEKITVAFIHIEGEAVTKPVWLHYLYEVLYRRLGTGARPLLELARRAEEAGDKELAGVLRRVYAILEASKDIVEEIEQADYRGVVEGEIEKIVEEAVKLLRRAKEAARKGDKEELYWLLNTTPIETTEYRIRLRDIIAALRGRYTGNTNDLEKNIARAADSLKRVDIYDTLITAAEHFGLEIRRR